MVGSMQVEDIHRGALQTSKAALNLPQHAGSAQTWVREDMDESSIIIYTVPPLSHTQSCFIRIYLLDSKG